MRSFILLGALCIVNAINPDYDPSISMYVVINVMLWGGLIMDVFDWIYKGDLK